MKRSALFAVVALLALAACASDKNSDSGTGKSTTSKKSATATTSLATKKNSAKAIATAKRLGCTAPKLAPTGSRFGLPRPLAIVTCTAQGVHYRVEVYATHADRVRLLSAAATKIRCGLLKAVGGKGPIYSVDGDDFSTSASGAPGAKVDAKALATALGAKLGLPVTTTQCPA